MQGAVWADPIGGVRARHSQTTATPTKRVVLRRAKRERRAYGVAHGPTIRNGPDLAAGCRPGCGVGCTKRFGPNKKNVQRAQLLPTRLTQRRKREIRGIAIPAPGRQRICEVCGRKNVGEKKKAELQRTRGVWGMGATSVP